MEREGGCMCVRETESGNKKCEVVMNEERGDKGLNPLNAVWAPETGSVTE